MHEQSLGCRCSDGVRGDEVPSRKCDLERARIPKTSANAGFRQLDVCDIRRMRLAQTRTKTMS